MESTRTSSRHVKNLECNRLPRACVKPKNCYDLGEYNFSGDLDLIRFIRLAQDEGLYVILRPGPYICAERDMGGLPYWLLNKHPEVVLRSIDPKYTEYVERWMNVLLPMITPLLYGNGGPVILIQVENEYGFYHACDHEYNLWLRDLFRKHVQEKAVLFTTDSPFEWVMKCGKIPGKLHSE